jgi:hypothetical protein
MAIYSKNVFIVLTAVFSTLGAASQIGFAAYYTSINKGQDWEAYSRTGNHADVVVKLPSAGGQLVFWKGNSYLPYWETNKGLWNFSEIVPRSGNGTSSMPDKANVYSHAEIIRSDSNQIVVQWRYLSEFAEGNPHKNVNPHNFVE